MRSAITSSPDCSLYQLTLGYLLKKQKQKRKIKSFDMKYQFGNIFFLLKTISFLPLSPPASMISTTYIAEACYSEITHSEKVLLTNQNQVLTKDV